MGLKELPKPFTDEDLRWRLEHSALKEFSQVYPYRSTYMIGETERVCRPYPGVPQNKSNTYSQVYEIPKHYYQDRTIMAVSDVNIVRPHGYNDLYVPSGAIGSPVGAITAMASMQMAASMSRTMTHAITWDFRPPNILIMYNGWSGGNYEIELLMSHDISLSTIDPTCSSKFLQLCEYDLEEYVYNRLKRVQNLELGAGSIELKIDDWSDAGNRKRELLDDLADASAMDTMHVQYW